MGKLTAKGVEKLRKQPGMHLDGDGLYLRVQKNKKEICSAAWIYRYNNREMGLGSITTVSLAEAREKAATARKLRLQGIDPRNSATPSNALTSDLAPTVCPVD